MRPGARAGCRTRPGGRPGPPAGRPCRVHRPARRAAHGGELRFDGRGQGQIVETGDGEVVGDAEPQPAGSLAGTRGEDVVVADDGGGPGAGGAECVLRSFTACLYVERRSDGPYGGAGHRPEGVVERPGTDRERPGVDRRREVDEAAVAEREQMLRDLPHAIGDVEVDPCRDAGVRRVAVEHDQRQAGAAQHVECAGGHGGGDHPVEGGARRGEGIPGRPRAFGGRVEDDPEAVFGGDRGGAGVDAREEFAGERGDDQQRGPGAAQAEVAGGEIGLVAEFVRGVPYTLGGGLGDPASPFVAQHEGDGGLRDARGPRDIAAGGPRRGGP